MEQGRSPRSASKTREYRSPLQRITDSKANAHAGSIYSGAVRVLKKDRSPQKTPQGKSNRPETHYMQPTESSRLNTPSRKPIVGSTPPRPQTPSRSVSPAKLFSTPENRRTSRILSPEVQVTSRATTPSKATAHEIKSNSSPQLKPYVEFATPPNFSGQSRKESSKISHSTRSAPKCRSSPAKSSRNPGDVFARLTQGLPTRHTAPPTSEHALPKRSGSTGRTKSRGAKEPCSHQTIPTTSPEKKITTSHRAISQSLLRHSHSDPEVKVSRVLHENETFSRTLTSQLLLPSPPRDFISCIPEPPYETIHSDRSNYKAYLQHLRELIDGKNHLASNDTTADSELTNSSSQIQFRTHEYELTGEQLFQTEVSIVEDSESRSPNSSSPRSLLSGSAWTTVSESIRPPFVDFQSETAVSELSSNWTSASAPPGNGQFDRKFIQDLSSREEPRTRGSCLVVSTNPPPQGSDHELEQSLGLKEHSSPHESFVTQSSAFNHLLNSTLSTCLSPTATVTSVNTLDRSFYLSQSSVIPRLNAPPMRRDSGIGSEASIDSIFLASGEPIDTQQWSPRDRSIEPLAQHLGNIDEEEHFNASTYPLLGLPFPPPPPPH